MTEEYPINFRIDRETTFESMVDYLKRISSEESLMSKSNYFIFGEERYSWVRVENHSMVVNVGKCVPNHVKIMLNKFNGK